MVSFAAISGLATQSARQCDRRSFDRAGVLNAIGGSGMIVTKPSATLAVQFLPQCDVRNKDKRSYISLKKSEDQENAVERRGRPVQQNFGFSVRTRARVLTKPLPPWRNSTEQWSRFDNRFCREQQKRKKARLIASDKGAELMSNPSTFPWCFHLSVSDFPFDKIRVPSGINSL